MAQIQHGAKPDIFKYAHLSESGMSMFRHDDDFSQFFGSRQALLTRVLPIALGVFTGSLHLCQPNHLVGRKGWSHMEVPSGWSQVIRGPRPRSQHSGLPPK